MSGVKRPAAASTGSIKRQKRQVTVATFKKWQLQHEQTLRCDFDNGNREMVTLLWCDACRKHEKRIELRELAIG